MDGVGGICQNRVRIKSDNNAYSFNALFISLKSSQEVRIPLRMGVLNLVHELMHSFGAKHDPEPTEEPQCTPHDKVLFKVTDPRLDPKRFQPYGLPYLKTQAKVI